MPTAFLSLAEGLSSTLPCSCDVILSAAKNPRIGVCRRFAFRCHSERREEPVFVCASTTSRSLPPDLQAITLASRPTIASQRQQTCIRHPKQPLCRRARGAYYQQAQHLAPEAPLHPDLEKLISVQRLDVELGKLREDLAAVPSRIAALAAKSAEAQAARTTLEDSVAKEEKLRRSQESDIESLKGRSAKLRKQMDVVTTTAQAAALDHEIAFLTSEIARIEDTELDSMARSEFLESQLPKARDTFTAAEANLERERTAGADRTAVTKTRIDALTADRTALRATVAEAALEKYDRIARVRGTAVSEGVNGKCSACQMMIRPQSWQDLRDRSRHDLMLTCDTCGRLLYWDPARDAPQKKPADREESIAARIVRSL